MKSNRSNFKGLAIIGGLIASLNFIHAAGTIKPVQSVSTDDMDVMLQAVEMTTPVSAESVPAVGTFYSAQNPNWPPLPGNLNDLPIWPLGEGTYLLDDRQFDYTALSSANAQTLGMQAMAMDAPVPGDGGSDDGSNGYSGFSNSYTIPTNGLWLQITNVANGLASLNLYNATGKVYAVWSTTNLSTPFAGWQVEMEVWPTNGTVIPTVTPFTILTQDRQDLFLRAEDWTGVDSDGDGIPDWWIWKYFNDLSENATNLDSSGNTLLYDYQNSLDPNVITFSIETTNNYVNTSANVQLVITGGTPIYYAVFVNSTSTTNWLPFTSTNLTVSLGSTDGVYDVVVGLKGLPADATQTWQDYKFIFDRVAPVLTITNPILVDAAGTVIKPYLQLQGFADKQLVSLSYDISNVFGLATNQNAFVTEQGFDTNKFDFTTNYFQAYDVPLAANGNAITLRVTDRAGNTTTTNCTVTLDYTTATNPPVVKLIWPLDGMAVSGSSCTMRGTMSDETGTVVAQIIDGDGNTNTVAATVERNGMFWLENVPLNGTNQISLQAMDAAGNVTTTNFTVIPGSINLTIDSTPTGDALYQPFGSVSGHVSDSTATVSVNGVQGINNGDGTWSADNVPVYGRGTATFDAVAVPATGMMQAMAQAMNNSFTPSSANASAAVEMGAYVCVANYSESEKNDEYTDEGPDWSPEWHSQWNKSYSATASPASNGQWQQTYKGSINYFETDADHLGTGWENVVYSWSDTDSGTLNYIDSYGNTNGWGPFWNFDVDHLWGSVPDEEYAGSPGGVDVYMTHYFADGSCQWNFKWTDGSEHCHHDISLSAQTSVKLYTGGKATINRQSLFCINASAGAYHDPFLAQGWVGVGSDSVDPTSLTVLGKHPGADGNLWIVLPDNSEQDITVTAPAAHHYDAGAGAQKYTPYITANGADLDNETPEFCVGQGVTFALQGLPGFVDAVGHWNLPGKYVNEQYPYSATCTSYRINSALLDITGQNLATSCWYVNKPGGTVGVNANLHFSNGQYASVAAMGNISVYRPTISLIADTSTSPSFFTAGSYPPYVQLGGDGDPRSGGHYMGYYIKYAAGKYSGTGGIAQLLTMDYSNPALSLSYPSFSDWRLDGNSEMYSSGPVAPPPAINEVFFQDEPAHGHLYVPWGTIRCKASFKDYCTFQPDGGIPVTLGIVTWSCDGESPDIGVLNVNSVVGPTGPTDSDEFPVWELIFSEGSNGNN